MISPTLKITAIAATFSLLSACGGGGGGGSAPGAEQPVSGSGASNPDTGGSDFSYPAEFEYIGDADLISLAFKNKANVSYFYYRDYTEAYAGGKSTFFIMDSLRSGMLDPNIKKMSCEIGEVRFSGDVIDASMWGFDILNTDCVNPMRSQYNGLITVNEIIPSGANEGDIHGYFGEFANAEPFYLISSDGLASSESKGRLGDYDLVYDNGSTSGFSLEIESLRISNYLADKDSSYSPKFSTDIPRTIRDFYAKVNDDSVIESLKYRRTWVENGTEFTMYIEGSNLVVDEATGGYTVNLDVAGSNKYDVEIRVDFYETYTILTHTRDGKTKSNTIYFY